MPYTDPSRKPEYDKLYRAANKEKMAAYQKKRREDKAESIKAYMREYYQANRERLIQASKEQYENHAEEICERIRAYRRNNLELLRRRESIYHVLHIERVKQYYARNKGRISVVHRSWCQRNKEKIAQYRIANRGAMRQYQAAYAEINHERIAARQRAHRLRNMDAFRSYVRNRRARLRGAQGTHNAQDIIDLFSRQKRRCANPTCRADLGSKFHVDHVCPLARGGGNGTDNLQLLCRICNQRKSARDEYEWAQDNGMLFPK